LPKYNQGRVTTRQQSRIDKQLTLSIQRGKYKKITSGRDCPAGDAYWDVSLWPNKWNGTPLCIEWHNNGDGTHTLSMINSIAIAGVQIKIDQTIAVNGIQDNSGLGMHMGEGTNILAGFSISGNLIDQGTHENLYTITTGDTNDICVTPMSYGGFNPNNVGSPDCGFQACNWDETDNPVFANEFAEPAPGYVLSNGECDIAHPCGCGHYDWFVDYACNYSIDWVCIMESTCIWPQDVGCWDGIDYCEEGGSSSYTCPPDINYCDGEIDDCGVCDAIDGYVAGSCYDCAGTPNGNAELDDCGVCDGIDGYEPNSCLDCNGVLNGDAEFDECGECISGGEGNTEEWNQSCLDECGGDGIPDGTCNCAGEMSETVCGSIYKDCWNDCECFNDEDGDGYCDEEDECEGEGFLPPDECGECGGGGIADGACDCDGYVLDECGVCGGDGVDQVCGCGLEGEFGLPDGSCDCDGNNFEDCYGVCGGEAVVDECGECGGGGIADGACDCDGNTVDCDGECGGGAVEDECGICNGDGSSCECIEENTIFAGNQADGMGCDFWMGYGYTCEQLICECGYDICWQCCTGCDDLYEDGCTDIIEGCTDPIACNYNADATEDDGSCLENDECGVCGGPGLNSPDGWCYNYTLISAEWAEICGEMTESLCDANWDDCLWAVNPCDCDGECGCDDVYGHMYVWDCGKQGCDTYERMHKCLCIPYYCACTCNFDDYDDCDGEHAGYQIHISADDPDGAVFECVVHESCIIEGCMDDSACNYNPDATDAGSCTYPEENFDCDGNCIIDVDCYSVCGGDAVEDCDGVCEGTSVVDECGVCNGDGANVECWDGSYECDTANCPNIGSGNPTCLTLIIGSQLWCYMGCCNQGTNYGQNCGGDGPAANPGGPYKWCIGASGCDCEEICDPSGCGCNDNENCEYGPDV